MKSRRVLRIAVALLAVVVSALFVTAQEDGSIMTRDAEGHQITAWGWDTLEFNRPILDYLEEHSGVVVEDLVFPSSEITQKLTVSAAAGGIGMPDVFKSGTYNVPLLVEMGALMDLTDLVAPYRDLLPEVAWEMVTYQDRIWGVPANSPAGGLFWRYDVVTEYGIDPTAIETWDDFVAAAQTIESESGGEVAMLQMPSVGLPYEVYATIQQEHRAELIGSDLTVKIGPDSAEWLATLEDWRAVRDGITGVEMEQWTQPWYQTIKDGSITVFPSGTWFVEVIKQQAPDSVGAWYFTPFPAVEEGGDRYPNFGSATCFISSATDDPVAGMEWVKVWTMEPASTLEIGLNQLGISVISKAALESPIVNAPHEYFAEDQAYWFDATEAFALSTYVPPVTKYDAEAGDIFNRYTEQWWLGNITDQEFLQSVADELAALVAE